jgi:enediyne biosynthesis protein E5
MSLETPPAPTSKSTPATAPAVPSAGPVWCNFGWDNRYLAPILVTCILLVGEISYGFLESYWATALAILTSIAMELVLGRLITGKWPHLASAYISGISVGILIRSQQLWPFALCSALAILSKYAIRVRGRHIWNPSNLSVSVMLFFLPAFVAGLSIQWGNDVWPMVFIWCLGTVSLYRLGFLHITLTYCLAFVVLAFVRIMLTGDGRATFPNSWFSELSPITGPMYQLYIFFMITDPKTTTRRKWSQCLVVVLVAVVEAVLRWYQFIYAPFYALFMVGPAANLIEIWWDARHPRPAAAPKELVALASDRNSLLTVTPQESVNQIQEGIK